MPAELQVDAGSFRFFQVKKVDDPIIYRYTGQKDISEYVLI
mgnify:CR=1 FL=1